MGFKTLVIFTGYEVLFLLFSLTGVVAYQMLTGKINLKGLLENKIRNENGVTLERVQLIIFTSISALYFILHVINDPSQFPTVPPEMVTLMGGSSLVYLGGKAYSFRKRSARRNPLN